MVLEAFCSVWSLAIAFLGKKMMCLQSYTCTHDHNGLMDILIGVYLKMDCIELTLQCRMFYCVFQKFCSHFKALKQSRLPFWDVHARMFCTWSYGGHKYLVAFLTVQNMYMHLIEQVLQTKIFIFNLLRLFIFCFWGIWAENKKSSLKTFFRCWLSITYFHIMRCKNVHGSL